MNLASKKAIQNLLKKYQVRPSKRLGQNFLIDKTVITKLTGAVNLKPKDIILEIGPGIGNLTQELAKKVKKVIAVEKDQKMVEILKETLKDYENVEIIKGDILKLDPRTYNLKPKIVVCRELTKKFETTYRGTIEEILKQLGKSEIKGEFVVVVEGKG